MMSEPNVWLQNTGFTETVVNKNGHMDRSAANWGLQYDGENAHLDFAISDKNRRKKIHMDLDKNDIMKLLEIPSEKIPLEKRLTDDFLRNDKTPLHATPLFLSDAMYVVPKSKQINRAERKESLKVHYDAFCASSFNNKRSFSERLLSLLNLL
jgi:hypothetical protein